MRKKGAKFRFICKAVNYVLRLEDEKARFIKAVTEAVAAYALSVPQPEALALKNAIEFFQAVKNYLRKF